MSSFPLALCFTHDSVCMSVLLSEFIPPSPSAHCVHMSVLYICVSLFLPCKSVHQYHFSRFHIYTCVCACFSHVRLFATQWTVVLLAPLSAGFSRKKHWSRLPCSPPGDLPNPKIKPTSSVAPALQADSLPLSHQGSPLYIHILIYIIFFLWLRYNSESFNFCWIVQVSAISSLLLNIFLHTYLRKITL